MKIRAVLLLWAITFVFLGGYLIFQLLATPAIRKLGIVDYNIREVNTKLLLFNSDLSLFKTHTNLLSIDLSGASLDLVDKPARTVVLHQYTESYEASR